MFGRNLKKTYKHPINVDLFEKFKKTIISKYNNVRMIKQKSSIPTKNNIKRS